MTRTKTQALTSAAMFAVLTALGGFLKIPTPLSAVTLQFFFTTAAGVLLGPVWGAVSQVIYVGLGLLGLPIFASGGGLSYLLTPSFGFLLGMIPAAWGMGRLCRNRQNLTGGQVFAAGLAGLVILYLVGLPYMYGVLRFYLGQETSLWTVLYGGCLIFLPGDLLKLALSAWLLPKLGRRLP